MLRSEPENGLTTQESLIMGVTQLEVQPETFLSYFPAYNQPKLGGQLTQDNGCQ